MEEVLRQCIVELGLERDYKMDGNYARDTQDIIEDYIYELSWNTNYFLGEIARKLEEKGFRPHLNVE